MVFELGKCYRHTTGKEIFICGHADTTMYGPSLVAETNKGLDLEPVSRSESAAVNWVEISKDEWMKNFSK